MKCITVCHVEELQAPVVVIAISVEISLSQHKSTSSPQLDIYFELLDGKRRQLVDLLADYGNRFVTSPNVRQALVEKHPVVTNGDVNPIHQS